MELSMQFFIFFIFLAIMSLSYGFSQEEKDPLIVENYLIEETAGFESSTESVAVIFDCPVLSQYIFRGIPYVDDWVWQPSVTLSYKDFSVFIWTNWNMTNADYYVFPDEKWKVSELDLYFSYKYKIDKLSITGYIIDYEFPNAPIHRLAELALGIQYEIFLNPTLTAYYECVYIHGWVIDFAVGHTFADVWNPYCDVNMSVALNAYVEYSTAPWLEYFGGKNKSTFQDAFVGIGFPFQIGKHLTVAPIFQGTTLIDSWRDITGRPDNFIFKLDATLVW
jgi:hypothetical protein